MVGLVIKSVTPTHAVVAGYGVVFGGVDLTGETFTGETDFRLDLVPRKLVLYDHGLDEPLRDEIGTVLDVRQDERGLWVEAQLDRRAAYVDQVLDLVQQGALGYSSGSVAHLVRREGPVIKSWPIVEFSLTPTPAEPRTSVMVGCRDAGVGGRGSGVGCQRSESVGDDCLQQARRFEMTTGSNEVQAGMQQGVQSVGAGMGEHVGVPQGRGQADDTIERRLKAMEDRLNSQVARLMEALDSAPVQRLGYVTADGGTADRQVKSLGDFTAAVVRRDVKRLEHVYGVKLSEGAGASGGFTVPEEFAPRIMRVAMEQSVVRPRADVRSMRGRSMRIPAFDYSGDYSAGGSAFLAGMTMVYVDEAGEIDEGDVTFRQIELIAHKLARVVPISSELLRDSVLALEQTVAQMFGEAIAFTEDYMFLRGDGVGKPLGVLNADACITTATALTSSPDVEKLLTMHKRLMMQSESRAVWVVHPLLWDAIAGLNASNYLTYLPDLNGRMEYRLFGSPVLRSEKMPEGFDAGGLLLADFSQYVVADAGGIEIAVSEHVYFESDQVGIRVTKRHDGQPKLNSAVKVGSGTNSSVSAFVKSK
jgi:HK97 family phage major capsid protein/HK97 family phage prohead protease